MKRFLCTLLAALLVLMFFAVPAAADFDPETSKISPQHAILIDADTGAVLYRKAADEKAYPASTTKIMTCILALELGDLDEEIVVGQEVWRGFGSQSSLMGLKEGERVTLRDLIYGTMLVSGNDAAAAIAVHIGGSISGFAELMNQKAAQLGMTGTHFVTPHGKHDDDHYTTAEDMAILARYAMVQSPKAQDFRAVVKRTTYHVDPTNRNSKGYDLENSNKLLYTKAGKANLEYRYATGIKTGDTNQALRCLVASAEKDGLCLICVLMEDQENDTRFTLAADMFEWAFHNLKTVSATTLGLQTEQEIIVKNCSFQDENNGKLLVRANLEDVEVTARDAVIQAVMSDPSAVTMEVAYDDDGVVAPVSEGDVLGLATYYYNGEALCTADVLATRSVAAMMVNSGDDTSNQDDPGSLMVGDVKQEGRNVSWVFWALLILVIIIIVCLVLHIINSRQIKRRRKRTSYRTYR